MKIMFAVDNKDNRERVFGAWGAKFMVVVKNLSPEVDTEALCSRFEVYGEIFQCKVDADPYGQHYGMIQYIEERSVELACQKANNTCMEGYSTILIVEPHKNRALFTQPVPYSSTMYETDFPAFEPPRPAPPPARGTAPPELKLPIPSPVDTARAAPPVSAHAPSRYQTVQENGESRVPSENTTGSSASHRTPILDLYLSNQRQQLQQTVSVFDVSPRSPYGQLEGDPYPEPAREGGCRPSNSPSTPAEVACAVRFVKPRQQLRSALACLDKLAELLCCPITQEPFKDPVIAADGHTYERSAIESWLKNNDTSPMTNALLPDKYLISNTLVKSFVEDFAYA